MQTVPTTRAVYVSPAHGAREAANDEPEWNNPQPLFQEETSHE